MAEEFIDLTPEETRIFIDLWEAHEVLWNVSNAEYRIRSARHAACAAISETMALNWTIDQVKRKIESLSAYYGATKRKLASGKLTGPSPRGKTSRVWVHYDRIRRFLSRNDDNPQAQMALSNGRFEDRVFGSQMQTGTGSSSDNGNYSAGSSDNEMKYKVQFAQSRETTSRQLRPTSSPQSHQTSHFLPAVHNTHALPTLPLVPANRKRPLVEKSSSSSSDDNDFVGKLTKSVIEQLPLKIDSMTCQSKNGIYGQYVSDRLDMITNQRRLLDVRHKIDCLIHKALMVDIPEQHHVNGEENGGSLRS